jgi:16S rRNA (cytidine1402-2'-O)-methyltransferase
VEGDVNDPDSVDDGQDEGDSGSEIDKSVDASGPGTLYVVSTPIGNMGDFSFRAVEVLKSVTAVLAEDTRHSRHLLDRYEIRVPLISYHEHNEAKTTPQLLRRLLRGESLALVSDAGTPLLSDPGARLVRAAADADVRIVPVPGASAMLAALVTSGLDVGRFTFFGFLTRTGGARGAELDEISSSTRTVVVYESANRVAATLGELEQRGNGERSVVVAREMTKQFEEVRRGTLSQLRAYYEDRPARGEIVLVIGAAAPRVASETVVRERILALRASGLGARDAAARVASELGVSKNAAYRIAQDAGTGSSTDDTEVDQ